jgi:hypothetical protein
MSEHKTSIFDGCKYVYAENLKGKKVKLTIKSVSGGVEFIDPSGRKAIGFDVSFTETDKVLGIASVTVRRQLASVTGTDTPSEMVGKQIVLYTVDSKKSTSGKAIRIAAVNE